MIEFHIKLILSGNKLGKVKRKGKELVLHKISSSILRITDIWILQGKTGLIAKNKVLIKLGKHLELHDRTIAHRKYYFQRRYLATGHILCDHRSAQVFTHTDLQASLAGKLMLARKAAELKGNHFYQTQFRF